MVSCKQEAPKKIYYVVSDQLSELYPGAGYRPKKDYDTIQVENDSLAFWKGVYQYVAELRTQNMLLKRGIKNPPYVTKGFDVLDDREISILQKIPPSELEKSKKFIEENKDN